MTKWLVIGVGVVYAIVAAGFVCERKYGMALAFAGYAVSNVGLFFAA